MRNLRIFVFGMFLPLGLAAQALPQGIQKLTSVEGITEYRLENGLRVLLFPDPTKNTITVNITYLVGSRNEGYGETGMAHLLEHMVFKGSPKHKNIPEELSAHGARPNGTTSWDRTNYFESFSATDENLRWALDLESDRMVNSFIAKKDLDSEMTVVRNEFESGENSPQGMLLKRTMEAAFAWHNYGKSTIGSKADLENVPIERLQAFYHNYYQPDNAVLTIAGKIDEAKTLGLVKEYFAGVARPTRKLYPTYTREPVQDGERFVSVRRTGDVQALCVAYHTPDGSHPDSAALDVLADLLSRPPAGRLYKALVETKKAASVFGSNFQLKEPGLLLFMSQVRKENSLDEARDALLKVVENLAKEPPTAEEVDRSKTELLKRIDLALTKSDEIGLALSEPIAGGDWRLFFLHRDRLKAVKPEDVMRVAKSYLKPTNRTVGAFYPTEQPDRAEIPGDSDLVAALKDYKGGQAVAQGESFDPSPANIDKRTVRGSLGNGVKLAFIPKKTRGNSVTAQLTLHLGDVESLKGQSTASGLAAAMLMRGTSKHTRQQITDELGRLKARVNVAGSNSNVRASIETTRENLPEVMKLVAEVLRDPTFPSDEFDRLKQQQLAQMESMRREPQVIAMSALQEHLSPFPADDPRASESIDSTIEKLKAATVDHARGFYKNFYGASNAELVVIGDFDGDQVQTLASNLFGDWKSPKPFRRIPVPYTKVDAVNKSFPTPDKANAMLAAGMPIRIGEQHPDYPAVIIGNYLLGSGIDSRLFKRIRQKEGLSYGVGSQAMMRPNEDSGIFMAFAIFAPQNVNKVEAALKEEIALALKDGFTAQEIETAKKGYLQSRNVSRSQDNELAGTLQSNAFEGRTFAFQADVEKRIAELTPQKVLDAMRRHIRPEDLSIYKAGDFAKAGVTP